MEISAKNNSINFKGYDARKLKALYMQNHLGEKFVGTISGVHEFGIFIELENTIEGLIRFEYLPVDAYEYNDRAQILKGEKHCYKLGDKLEVICVNANTRLRQIDFEGLEGESEYFEI